MLRIVILGGLLVRCHSEVAVITFVFIFVFKFFPAVLVIFVFSLIWLLSQENVGSYQEVRKI